MKHIFNINEDKWDSQYISKQLKFKKSLIDLSTKSAKLIIDDWYLNNKNKMPTYIKEILLSLNNIGLDFNYENGKWNNLNK